MADRTRELYFDGRWRRLAVLGLGFGAAVASGCAATGKGVETTPPQAAAAPAETQSPAPASTAAAATTPYAVVAELPPVSVVPKLPEQAERVIRSPLIADAAEAKPEDTSIRQAAATDKADDPAAKPGADGKADSLPTPRTLPPEKTPPRQDVKVVDLKPATPQAEDVQLPINLATALRLADARPLVVAAAQAGSWVAQARLGRAKVLWIPTLFVGSCYIRHDGPGPDFINGWPYPNKPLNQNVNFLYNGAGAVNQFTQLTDAIFEPLAAKQDVQSRQADVQTAKNDALMDTANAYFRVHQYRGMYAGERDVVERGQKLVKRIEALSKDLVPKLEVDRARKLVYDLEQRATAAREEWRVASADLTQTLRLDPRAVVVPLEDDHLQIAIVDPDRPLDDLIPIALTNRPELASQQALVREILVRIRQEKMRPFIPTLYLNGFQTPNEMIQGGYYMEGHGNQLNLSGFRNDVTLQMMWEVENMGFGNAARVRERRAEHSRVMVDLFRVQDAVAGDVTRAQARLQSAAKRVVQAERSMKEAIITFDGNYEGLRQTTRFEDVLIEVYRPQEAVAALDNLRIAYENYFTTVAEYNRAQFELYHALGYPASEVMNLPAVGKPDPVNTERPPYLPPVGDGPPRSGP